MTYHRTPVEHLICDGCGEKNYGAGDNAYDVRRSAFECDGWRSPKRGKDYCRECWPIVADQYAAPEPKVRIEPMLDYGKTKCALIYLGDENIGRVIGQVYNTKHTDWLALGVHRPDKPFDKPLCKKGFIKRQEAIDAVVADWKGRAS